MLMTATLLWGSSPPRNQSKSLLLALSHARTGEVLFTQAVHAKDVIRLSWIHSVELTPWEEYYHILSTGELLLVTTRFQSYGAGVPEYGGTFRKERDWMIYEDINKVLPALQWIHSRSAKFQVQLNNNILLRTEDMPHHEPLKLSIRGEIR
ncbi:DUF1850 domain-containing protein [Desulforhopalus sp. IMCC35007]|uniref:DUF1850 domain-containing protein n=1 Tax=Desulforhopalus sp. IMCC35007 TaxID=2569543 RepID=UPI001F10F576|nr:DUF1850 domain-containing protein [Desulforhopalus sp. IMCC35007]